MKKQINLLCLIVSLSLPLSAVLTTGCAGDRNHRSTGAYLDDKSISTKIKTKFLSDPDVKGTQVKVKTFQGKVQLSGFVDNQLQKDRASDIARRVKGVEWVKNDLIVKNVLPGSAAGAATPSNQTGTGTLQEKSPEKTDEPQ